MPAWSAIWMAVRMCPYKDSNAPPTWNRSWLPDPESIMAFPSALPSAARKIPVAIEVARKESLMSRLGFVKTETPTPNPDSVVGGSWAGGPSARIQRSVTFYTSRTSCRWVQTSRNHPVASLPSAFRHLDIDARIYCSPKQSVLPLITISTSEPSAGSEGCRDLPERLIRYFGRDPGELEHAGLDQVSQDQPQRIEPWGRSFRCETLDPHSRQRWRSRRLLRPERSHRGACEQYGQHILHEGGFQLFRI